MPKLQNKSALITGGARGIGAAIARLFAQEGAQVIIADVDAENGSLLTAELSGAFFHLDVSAEKDWDLLAAAHPVVDIVVNNAGITGFEDSPGPHDPENATLAEWHRVHAVNLDGTFLGCRYAIKAMRAKGSGSIINMSSRSGLVGIPGAAAYASSKAAIRNHSKSVALYCAGQGLKIRCNSIHPAAILTPMWEAMIGDGPGRDARMAAMVSDTPLKRFGTVEEVAAVALLLASDDASYMTGSEIHLDGGLLAGSAASPGE
ncbi:SDR family NAD(P)-dependent oxidoreductase [Sphingorhabdus sp.]|uniref:SDR family NAD(P)-dependent oxidoreductase n=1 Tax=Sphingorhabdus sp. TaxID=1902408 RepID=UPI0039832B4D